MIQNTSRFLQLDSKLIHAKQRFHATEPANRERLRCGNGPIREADQHVGFGDVFHAPRDHRCWGPRLGDRRRPASGDFFFEKQYKSK